MVLLHWCKPATKSCHPKRCLFCVWSVSGGWHLRAREAGLAPRPTSPRWWPASVQSISGRVRGPPWVPGPPSPWPPCGSEPLTSRPAALKWPRGPGLEGRDTWLWFSCCVLCPFTSFFLTSRPSTVTNGTSHSPTALNGAPSPPSGFSNGPSSSSSSSLANQQLPPACGARQLSKLKRFLTTLQQFGNDISPEIGERVRTLVLGLVVSRPNAAQPGGRERAGRPQARAAFSQPFSSTRTWSCVQAC